VKKGRSPAPSYSLPLSLRRLKRLNLAVIASSTATANDQLPNGKPQSTYEISLNSSVKLQRWL
jgi:hypothetical protein